MQDGRLKEGDQILQIGDVNVGGMGSEEVAQVLRKADQHVKLVVSRMVKETPDELPYLEEVCFWVVLLSLICFFLSFFLSL